jgi:hypothetical protein
MIDRSMKHSEQAKTMRTAVAIFSLLALNGLSAQTPAQTADDPLLVQSRLIIDEFAQTLQAALQTAIGDGGPIAAIDVCKTEAIEIASALSRRHGAKVSRTSRRTRNPLNLPEPWQAAVLDEFEAAAEPAGSEAGPAEYFANSAGEPARYLRAIRVGGLCLVCHGTAIPAEVAAILDREYPFDRARGYEAGDLRGAFSVVWPLDSASATRVRPDPDDASALERARQ